MSSALPSIKSTESFSPTKSLNLFPYLTNDGVKSIPFIFNRNDQIVSQSISALTEFFNMVKDLRNAYWRLDQSEKLVYKSPFWYRVGLWKVDYSKKENPEL